GCGGGYDIFGGLPYYFKIKSNGIDDVTLINYTFTTHTLLSQYSQQLSTARACDMSSMGVVEINLVELAQIGLKLG
ncbi:unnamed protein product, partial [Rotaria sp. Silwood1]